MIVVFTVMASLVNFKISSAAQFLRTQITGESSPAMDFQEMCFKFDRICLFLDPVYNYTTAFTRLNHRYFTTPKGNSGQKRVK